MRKKQLIALFLIGKKGQKQTIHALKESSIVNKIYLLNIEPNKTLSTPKDAKYYLLIH